MGDGQQSGDEDEGSADGSSATTAIIVTVVVVACVVLGGVAAVALHYNSKSGADAEVRVRAQGKFARTRPYVRPASCK